MREKGRAKKLLAISMSILLVLGSFVTGCGGSSSSTDETKETSSSEASNTGTAEYTLKIGHDHTTQSPLHLSMLDYGKAIEEASDGRIKVEVYPAQALGSSREMIEMMQMGALECTFLPTAKFGGFDERLNLADMPFLCDSEEVFMELFNGDIGKEAMSGLNEIGIQGMAFFPEGYKYITNNIRPITAPEDMKGLKIRTMEAPIIMSMFKCWGANPVPVDFSEVYNSLQQGVVDGQENPLLSIHDMRFYEVQKYMTVDTHAYLSYFLSFSKSWFDSLPEDLREIIEEQSAVASKNCTAAIKAANDEYYNTIVGSGTEVYTLSPEETEQFKKACEPVYEEYRDVIGGDFLDRAVAESQRLAKEK